MNFSLLNLYLSLGAGERFLEHLSRIDPLTPWITVEAPPFGIRPYRKNPYLFSIGDAAAIPPANGAGIVMGLESGLMAAERIDLPSQAYRRAWKKRIRWGTMVHSLLLHPAFSKNLRVIPKLAPLLYRLTRGKAL